MLSELIRANTEQVDLIVLPEMCTTGFSMEAKQLAEKMDGPSMSWLRELSSEKDAAIVCSLIMEENNRYTNRLIFMKPDGDFLYYDKRHLFSFAGEHQHFSAGTEPLVVEYKDWRIMPLVCYDLRFPVWSRNKIMLNNRAAYDVLIYVANWPEARRKPWINLLEARAHENQAYVVGVNRVGTDGKNISYVGDSAALSMKGETLVSFEKGEVGCRTVSFDKNDLTDFRTKFPALDDADDFEINY